ncbi:hypothetical protein SASPL_103378 [Salvia splendens]|uniref:OTU domain-containing protein n=1 Tax=Salvia splendens TaxID=180675 RepID=A0A8X8YT01_SALSN|nr:hypothetical protein SASPL_103378 [Salvia splendens]
MHLVRFCFVSFVLICLMHHPLELNILFTFYFHPTPKISFAPAACYFSLATKKIYYTPPMRNGTTYSDGASTSTSTSLSSQQDVEDDRMIAVVLSEEYAKLDGAVGRRLTNLAPVPHFTVFKAGLAKFIPQQGINVYGLYEVRVSGDGNCQFRALSDQIYRSPEHHKHVRKEVVKQLKDNYALYEAYVPMNFKRYYKKMAKSGEWGDHVTLQAAADKVQYT